MNPSELIPQLQAEWTRVTGQPLHARATERLFYEIARLDISADDLRCALEYMLAYNRKNAGGAQFRINAQKILGDPETFASTLGEALAWERNRRPKPTARQQVEVLRERPVDPEQASTLKPRNDWQSLKQVINAIGDKKE